MNKKDPMQNATKPKKIRRLKGSMSSTNLSLELSLQRHTLGTEAGICLGKRSRMNQRSSGILLHPTSLTNEYFIGNLEFGSQSDEGVIYEAT